MNKGDKVYCIRIDESSYERNWCERIGLKKDKIYTIASTETIVDGCLLLEEIPGILLNMNRFVDANHHHNEKFKDKMDGIIDE